MKVFYNIFLIAFSLLVLTGATKGQVTGLSGWSIFLDPGHSQNENMGVYNYSEARKVLRVGLELRDILLTKTDIDTVYMSRTDDQQSVSITQRINHANSVGADWFHSIHSDAAGPTANSILILISDNCASTTQRICSSRWGVITINMGNFQSDIMSRAYQIPTRGVWGDRSFGLQMGTSYGSAGVGVLRETNMPGTLSEGGFHTNPRQNQLNMNAKWKRLEAYSLFWSFLEYKEIQRPFVGITTGIISDIESTLPINGAIVSINGQVDTTDTYESLFHLYSNDPNQLRNGFYFFEDLPPGTFEITVQAEGFEPYSSMVTIQDTFFTFKDIQLVSNVPPTLAESNPAQGDSIYLGVQNIGLRFSRPMDRTSFESTMTLNPPAQISFAWSDADRRVAVTTSNLTFDTQYQLTISGQALDKYGHQFDGNGDGIGGDDYVLNFKTKVQDVLPPVVVSTYPLHNSTEVELRPIISFQFDERLNSSTITGKVKLIRNSDQSNVPGVLRHYLVNERSVINYFPTSNLQINENYTARLEPGVKDIFGNELTELQEQQFTTGNTDFSVVSSIDNFESGITGFWAPQQSGSTIGILTDLTGIASSTSIFNYIAGGSRSMQLTYGWDNNATGGWLIRVHRPATTPTFTGNNILQTYVYGDGKGNKFRFCIRETASTQLEVSPWYNVDWIGWRLVSWDMLNDGTGSWLGNGIIEGTLRFDSYQTTYEAGNTNIGELFFDDLRVVNKVVVGIDDDFDSGVPSSYRLEQNYPNPFNPSTQIKFAIPEAGRVKLEIFNLLGQKIAELVDEDLGAGYHTVDFNADNLSSGVYIYTINTNSFTSSKKMILLR